MKYSYIENLPSLVDSKCEEFSMSLPTIDRRILESGRRVLSHAIDKSLNRRVALESGIAALKSFSKTHKENLARVRALSVIKSILFLDNSDKNQFSLPMIFKLRSSNSVIHMWAEKLHVSPKLMKKYFLTKEIKSLLSEAENHYVNLYDEFLAVRIALGASDDSSSINSSSNGTLLRVDWSSMDKCFLAVSLGEKLSPKTDFPLNQMTWVRFFEKHCFIGLLTPKKKKVAWRKDVLAVKENQPTNPAANKKSDSKENQCNNTHRAANKKSVDRAVELKKIVAELSKDDTAKQEKFGGVFKCGIAFKTKDGVLNPYFKTSLKAKLKNAEKNEATKRAGNGN
jgi:hypothetical protein